MYSYIYTHAFLIGVICSGCFFHRLPRLWARFLRFQWHCRTPKSRCRRAVLGRKCFTSGGILGFPEDFEAWFQFFSTKTNNWCGKIKKLSARWVDYGLMGYLWWLIGFTMVYRTTYPLVIEHSYAKWSVYRWFTSKKWWCSSSLSSFTRDNHGLPHYLGVTVTMLSASFLSQALKSGAVLWFLDSVAASGSRQMGPLWHRTFWGLKNR